MSTINVNEIRDTTGSTNIAPAIPALEPRLASAWINYGAGSGVIRDSLNVSSLTDHGSGDESINFTANMPNTNYVAITTVGKVGATAVNPPFIAIPNGKAVGSVRIRTQNTVGGASDQNLIDVVIFGG